MCGIDPKALARSRKIACSSFFSFLAVCSLCKMVLACFKHPEKPPIPAFCIEVLTKLLICRKAKSLWATILKKTFSFTFRRLIWWNGLMVAEFFSSKPRIPPTFCHAFGMLFYFHATTISFQRCFRTPGVFLYSLYVMLLCPGADADLACFTALSTFLHMGGLVFWWLEWWHVDWNGGWYMLLVSRRGPP